MTYDEIKKLEPRLEELELHLQYQSRMLKRQNEYDRSRFAHEEIIPLVKDLVGPFQSNNMLNTVDAYRAVLEYFAEQYPPYNLHLVPQCNIFTNEDPDDLRDQIDDFLAEEVSRIISFQMIPDETMYIASLVYYPY